MDQNQSPSQSECCDQESQDQDQTCEQDVTDYTPQNAAVTMMAAAVAAGNNKQVFT